MFVSITRFSVDPTVGLDHDRIDTVSAVTTRHPGWLGAYVFESAENPGEMMRFTYWQSLEARDALYDNPEARAAGMTRPEGREVLKLVRVDRPIEESNVAPAPPTA